VRVAVCTERAAWDDFVTHAGGGLLQSWRWGELRRRQGWTVLRLVAVQGTEPRAAVQVLARAVPVAGAFFYAAEGPVLPAADWASGADALSPLFHEARRRGRALGALTLRVDPLTGAAGARDTLASLGLRRSPENVQPAATAVVDLDRTEEQLLAGLDRGARYLLRYARRKGVVIRPGAAADIAPLAHMIEETGQRKGFGTRNETYLRELDRALDIAASGHFFVAEIAGETVASMLAAPYGPRYFALYAAGNAVGRKVGAQYLIHWEAILHARRLGLRSYDFRGIGAAGDPSDHWAGLTFFKKRFGTRREELPGAWDDVYRPLAYRSFLLAQQARRDLPVRLRALRIREDARTGDTERMAVNGDGIGA